MFFNIFQLLFLLLLFCSLAALTGNRPLRFAIAALGTLVFAAQISSLLISGDLIGYRYYAHFMFSVASAVGDFFMREVLITTAASLGAGLFIYLLGTWLVSRCNAKWPFLLASAVFLGGLFFPGGIAANAAELARIHFAPDRNFKEALARSGLENYTPKEELSGTAGNNVIVIFMESLELGFLQEKLAHLTPNLNRLRDRMTFYPMTQNEGGDFTTGALYTYMTGLPMIFKNHGNNALEDAEGFELSSLPQVLDRAGYQQRYIAGKTELFGLETMWSLMGVEVKSERDYELEYDDSHWGLHDWDLFTIAQEELDTLYDSERPFALYLSTVSTHPTDGIRDKRVEKKYPPQASQLELLALALDDYIGQLVAKLEQENRLDSTSIYILPDHLLMGSYPRVLDDMEEPRHLFLLTNTQSDRFANGDTINQIDVAGLILEGAGVKHNLHLLSDQVDGDPTPFLDKQRVALLQLNEAAVIRKQDAEQEEETPLPPPPPKPKKQVKPKPRVDQLQFVSNSYAGGNVGSTSYAMIGPQELAIGRGVNAIFVDDDTFVSRQFDTWGDTTQADGLLRLLDSLRESGTTAWILVHDSAGEALVQQKEAFTEAHFPVLANTRGRTAYFGHLENGRVSEVSDPIRIDTTFARTIWTSVREPAQKKADARDISKWIAHAGGMYEGLKYPNFQEALDYNYARGFRYFELDILETTDGQFVAAHDWGMWRQHSGYAGEGPVSHDVFMQQPLHGKYTPMDMDAINRWFVDHPDAILVTDKTDLPEKFIAEFVDKDRLIMELFTFRSVRAAAQLGIRGVLVTEALTWEMGSDWLRRLDELGADGLAISVRTAMKYPAKFLALKKAGIKTYAFHIGHDGLDEDFMARYGLDLVHGLYADDWDFELKE